MTVPAETSVGEPARVLGSDGTCCGRHPLVCEPFAVWRRRYLCRECLRTYDHETERQVQNYIWSTDDGGATFRRREEGT